MSQFKDLRIDQVISLIKSGDRVAAKKLLTEVLQSHPSSADGWYLASLLADKPDQQVRALERTLAIDPRHENAQRRLEKLQSDSGTLDALLDGLPSNGEPSRTSFPSPQQRPKARATLRTILLLIFIVAIVIGLGVIALLNLGKNEISVLSFPSEAKTALDQYVKSNVQPLPDSGDHSIRAVQKASNIKAAAPLFSQPDEIWCVEVEWKANPTNTPKPAEAAVSRHSICFWFEAQPNRAFLRLLRRNFEANLVLSTRHKILPSGSSQRHWRHCPRLTSVKRHWLSHIPLEWIEPEELADGRVVVARPIIDQAVAVSPFAGEAKAGL